LTTEFSQINVGRRSSARAPSTGEICAGALTLSVDDPSGFVAAVEPPTAAEGAVIAWGAVLQATPAISKARHKLTRKNFIKQISKMWPAECCDGAASWDSCIHMAGQIVSEFHTAGE
jgi:hypothetical protein